MRFSRYRLTSRIAAALLFACATGVVLSQARTHKVVAPPGKLDERSEGVRLIQDYGSYRLYRVTDEALGVVPQVAREQIHVADDMDTIKLDAYPLDTRDPVVHIPPQLTAHAPSAGTLQLVQFVGPIKQGWLDQLSLLGVRPIQYIDSNAYLVWADNAGRDAIDGLVAQGDFLQYSGAYHPYYKLGPSLRDPLSGAAVADRLVPVTIQILDREGAPEARKQIEAASVSIDSSWESVLSYKNIQVTLPLSRITDIAFLPDVTWIGERFPIQLNDEVQDQIIAAHFDGPRTGPSGPGYKAFLDGKGFSQNPADYPIVNLSDDGVGNGAAANGAGDPVLTTLMTPATTRLAFVTNCTSSGTAGGVGGHGHLNTSIVGGYDVRAGQPFRDVDGFQRGLGVSPYGRMGMSKIFTDAGSFDQGGCGGTNAGVISSGYTNGARISSNSWGCGGCAGTYDVSSQAYDAGTRDAVAAPGNQEMLFVFSAGNSGPGAATVGTPGNGKNMITVAASENDRPTADGALWNDGCGVGASGADNAMDVIGFSSRGPSPGGRKKPEIIAPGTHIQGTASTNGGYTGNSVCDTFMPTTQTTFAASSGTSHSAPAVAGVASLYHRWLQTHNLNATPSPALTKAYLLTHTTYLTGSGANDTLPSNTQGYGMPNLEMAFDSTSRFLLDQSVVLDSSGQTWQFFGSVADNTKPVRIVMVYTDAPGATGTSPQVNDLDLTAVVGGSTYLGNVFTGANSVTGGAKDALDNYEAVYLPAGTTGAINVTVTGFNIAGDGIPNSGDATDQDFALVCYNCATCAGVVSTNKAAYKCTDTITITLGDSDLAGAGTYNVEARSGTESTPETVVLTETPAGSGSFTGTINTIPAPPAPVHGDGAVSVVNGDTVTIKYIDVSQCGTPNVVVEKTAAIDCVGPVITNVHTGAITGTSASILWDTNEPANSSVTYGFAPPPPGTTPPANPSLVVSHSFPLSPLSPCSNYVFSVASTDVAGNSTSDNNSNAYYAFSTPINLNRTYNYPGPAVPIPDNNPAGAQAVITVPDSLTIADVKVRINSLTHTYDADLEVHLIGPNLTDVMLSDNRGGSADNFINTTFDDDAGTPISAGVAPFTGSFRPDAALSAFDGGNTLGQWKLFVVDQVGVDVGNINSWDIIFQVPGACGAPSLEYSSSTNADSCNGAGGNAAVDPGENVVMQMSAHNNGTGGTTGVTGTLSSPTPGVTVTDPNGAWPNIPVDGTAATTNPFGYTVGTSVPCGSTIDFTVNFNAVEGNWSDTFSVLVGNPATPDPSCLALPPGLIELTTDNGSTGDNYISTVFDDGAATAVTAGVAPFTGSFRPEGSLAVVNGSAPNGTWKLIICDDANLDTGTLDGWGLVVTTGAGTTTYNSTDTPKAIPDVRDPPTISPVTVADTSSILDVNVNLTAHHTFDGDLDIYLMRNQPPLCASCVPSACGEATNLRWTAGSKQSLEWNSATNATFYNAYRGVPADLPNLYNANPDSCKRATTGSLTTGNLITEAPSPGLFSWFLVRGANGGGEGPSGNGTPGPRTQNSSGNCP